MSSVVISGNTSGSITLDAPAVAGSTVLTLAAATGTLSPLVSDTSKASTSGTTVDFTGIPSWAKRITVMLLGVSKSGTSQILIQVGNGSFVTSGYLASSSNLSSASISSSYTTGFGLRLADGAGDIVHGALTLYNFSGNTWVANGVFARSDNAVTGTTAGSIALAGTLDRVRITTVNGTDTFDAGSINIMYE